MQVFIKNTRTGIYILKLNVSQKRNKKLNLKKNKVTTHWKRNADGITDHGISFFTYPGMKKEKKTNYSN